MTMVRSQGRPVELDDVQGLVRSGYGRLEEACFLLLRIKDVVAARNWLAKVEVTTAVDAKPRPTTALHVALTSEGLCALEVAPDLREGFAAEFRDGMVSEARVRRLGDVDGNDPSLWKWGVGDRVPHVAVLLYAEPGGLAALAATIESECADGFECIARLSTSRSARTRSRSDSTDGISQPRLDWDRTLPTGDHDQLEYSNCSRLGEFLLGYPNEYGLYTPRPLLDPQRDPRRRCSGPRMRLTERISDGMAAISCCASCTRTWKASSARSTSRRTVMRSYASGWPRRWWAARKTAHRS